MELKPLCNEKDYELAMDDLKTIEAMGLMDYYALLQVEIISQLLQAYEANHNPIDWYLTHRFLSIKPKIKAKKIAFSRR